MKLSKAQANSNKKKPTTYDIFLIKNVNNGKVYIGMASNMYACWNDMKIRYEDSPKKICLAMKKYGTKQFELEQLAVVEGYSHAKKEREQYISKYGSRQNGYNEDIPSK